MDILLRWRDEHKMLPLLLAASLVILLCVIVGCLWARGSGSGLDRHFVSLDGMRGAYAQVLPGRTSQAQLAALGFDPARLTAQKLSGLGVQEYFMPRTSRDFDRLDPAVRACFDAPDRCNALVFPAARQGGFMAAEAAPANGGRIVFLMKSGRVAYKMLVRG
jgi:hypothetical protein